MIAIEKVKTEYGVEMAFTIMACRLFFKTSSAEELRSYLHENQLDWNAFYRIIVAHNIRPIIYKVITEHNIQIESQTHSKLKRDILLLITISQQKVKQTIDTYTHLNQKGIATCFYKGVILSKILFGDYTSREVSDIDILININDFTQTKGALEEQGFTPRYNYKNQSFFKHLVKIESEYKCAANNQNSQNKIELHWSASPLLYHTSIDTDTLINNKSKITILDKEVDTLDIHNHILVVLTHHGMTDVWRLLKHLADWAMIVTNNDLNINWNILNKKINDSNLSVAASTGSEICYQLFGVTSASFIKKASKPSKLIKNLLTFQKARQSGFPVIKTIMLQSQLKENNKQRLKLIKGIILAIMRPTVQDIQYISLPSPLHFLYYLLRPFRLLFPAKSN